MSLHQKKIQSWWYALFAILLFPAFSWQGFSDFSCFVDGLTYGSIARNWAGGEGGFWTMHYTEYLYPRFVEHPPLFFFLEGLLFHFLGDRPWVEEVFMFILWMIMVSLLAFANRKLGPIKWLLASIIVILPGIAWSFQNNMIESLLAVLFLASVIVACKKKDRYFLGVILGLLTTAAVLSKGPVSLPLVGLLIPLLIVRKQLKKLLGLLSIAVIISAYLYCDVDSWDFWNAYYLKQIVGSADQGSASISQILSRLLGLLVVVIPAYFIVHFLYGKKWLDWTFNANAKWCLCIGLATMIPWVFFAKFNYHYWIPGWTLLWYGVLVGIDKIKWSKSLSFSIVLFLGCIIFSLIDRNKGYPAISLVNEPGLWEGRQEVYIEKSLYTDWYLFAAFQRIRCIDIRSLDQQELDIYGSADQVGCEKTKLKFGYYLCTDD